MPFVEISKNVFDCAVCEHKCDSTSKTIFDFDNDIEFSNYIQNLVIGLINRINNSIEAFQFEEETSYPDIIVRRKDSSEEIAFIEIKVQARTFMKIRELLPESNLYPSETLALNLSDLERYFAIKDKTHKPVFIVWCLVNRACITGLNFESLKFFHQELDVLRRIRSSDTRDARKFRRKSGRGDVNESGEHKGVVVNYHFSINELNSGLPFFE